MDIETKVVDKTNTSNFFCKLKKVKEDTLFTYHNYYL